MTDGQHTEPVPWKMNFFICSLLLLFGQQQNLFLVHKYMLFHSYDQFPMQKYDKNQEKRLLINVPFSISFRKEYYFHSTLVLTARDDPYYQFHII